jgi:hypothetical protein
MTPLPKCPGGELLLDLLRAFQVRDERLNALAEELLGRCGAAPVRQLDREATSLKNRPAHHLRVLRAIRRIGPVADLASYVDLSVLTQVRHPGIRAAVAQLLGDLAEPQAELAEEPGLAQSSIPVESEAGEKRRSPVAAGDERAR